MPLDEIIKLKDPAARTREAVRFAAYAEARSKQGRDIRDAGIRALRQAGKTIPEIVKLTGVNLHTVKAVLR